MPELHRAVYADLFGPTTGDRIRLADTALFGARAATVCGLDFFGLDNVVFASDTPFEPTPGLYIRETIKVIESLDLTADQKDQIFRRNAAFQLHHAQIVIDHQSAAAAADRIKRIVLAQHHVAMRG